jgi:hypothetical protein
MSKAPKRFGGVMKPKLLVIAAVAALVAVLSGSSSLLAASASSPAGAKQSGFLNLPPAAPAGEMVLYGHIKKLTRKGGHFELRFDPAWFTSGVTASRAALDDTGSSDVPNDNYIIEEGHRLLTYLVPMTAHVTVLTGGPGKAIGSTAITASELARIVNGGKHRKLFEGLNSGIWIRVHSDRVLEVDQQYHP